MSKADTALYRSKSRGRGRFSFFSGRTSDPSLVKSNQSTQCGLMVLIAMCCYGASTGRAVIARRRRARDARNVRDRLRSLPRSSSTPANPDALSSPSPARPAPASRRSPKSLSRLLPEGSAAIVPMDGFHYDDAVLAAKGLRQRKGAPETFDFDGYEALLKRLRAGDRDVAIPVFDRSIELSRAAAAIVPRDVEVHAHRRQLPAARRGALVAAGAAARLHDLPDVPREELERRLIQRWLDHGRTPEDGRNWVNSNDLPNVDRVLRGAARPISSSEPASTDDGRPAISYRRRTAPQWPAITGQRHEGRVHRARPCRRQAGGHAAAQRRRSHGARSRPGGCRAISRAQARPSAKARGDGRKLRHRHHLPAFAGRFGRGHGRRGRHPVRHRPRQDLAGNVDHRRCRNPPPGGAGRGDAAPTPSTVRSRAACTGRRPATSRSLPAAGARCSSGCCRC